MLTKKLLMLVAATLSRPGESLSLISVGGSVSGGSIHQAFRINSPSGSYFIKCSKADLYPRIFETEFAGLDALRKTNTVKVPEIISYGQSDGIAFLLMEFHEAGKRKANYYEQLGIDLALLHRHQNNSFGWDENNYIGTLHQKNTYMHTGSEFLIEMRYRPLVEMAVDKNLLTSNDVDLFEDFYKLLPKLLPDEKPSMLHGDLWSGNVICGNDGGAWLIDPSVYYGYRETDLAMAKLFGGFNDTFYESYNEAYPLYPGWEARIGLFQLYPLLVHVNLFGSGYRQQLMQELKALIR